MASVRTCLMIAMLGSMTIRTICQNPVWKSPDSVWRVVTEQSPRKQRGHLNLGRALMSADPDEAMKELATVLVLNDPPGTSPENSLKIGALVNITTLLIQSGRSAEAQSMIERYGFKNGEIASNLAVAQMRQGFRDEARRTLLAATATWPDDGMITVNLGEMSRVDGRCAEAHAFYAKSIAQQATPDFTARPCNEGDRQ